MGIGGIFPDVFWNSTWKECDLMLETKVNDHLDQWDMVRFIVFNNYKTVYNDMSGKPIFNNLHKPSDVMRLPQDDITRTKKPRQAKFDLERALAAREGRSLERYGVKTDDKLAKVIEKQQKL